MSRHLSDPYVKQAQKDGYRSRSAYKLIELNDKDKLIRPGMRLMDLGSAPGGWSQVAGKLVGEKGRVLATDILPMDALKNVDFITPLAHRQSAQHYIAAAHAFESGHFEADDFAHAANLALAALTQYESQLIFVLPGNCGAPKLHAIERQSILKPLHSFRRQTALHANEVFLLDLGVLADELFCHPPVLRENQQPGRVDIQASGGGQALQLGWIELHRRGVARPAVLGAYEYDSWFIAILGLPRYVTHRLVEQDGHLGALVLTRRGIDLDARLRGNPHAQLVHHLAINPYPAADNPFFGLAARAQSQFAHALGQAGEVRRIHLKAVAAVFEGREGEGAY